MLWWVPLLSASLVCAQAPIVYSQVSDMHHPSFHDYRLIQQYIRGRNRPELKLLKTAMLPGGVLQDYNCRARRFRLIGAMPWELPQYGVVAMGTAKEDKTIAVCTYASYNKHYPNGVKLLQEALARVGFKGHFIYRIGGWPDVEGGSLGLAHVPYAFKPCFFRELARQGYKHVLWLDASIRPQKNLDAVFQMIEKQGYFLYPGGHTLAQFCTKEAMEALGEAPENAGKIDSIIASVVGMSLVHPVGRKMAEQWYEAAKQEIPFFSPRPDQNPLSVIAYQLGCLDWDRSGSLAWDEKGIGENTLFFQDWKSIQ